VFRTERITAHHNLASFACGDESLDTWLRYSALTADRMGHPRTHVWANEVDDVVAYFATLPWWVTREELPGSMARGGPDRVSAVLIAKLALHQELRGNQEERYGTVLLLDALRVALEGIRLVGGRVVLVDAINDNARGYYEHHGFTSSPGDENRLFMKSSRAAQLLGVDWP
jgi:hypothetical protein